MLLHGRPLRTRLDLLRPDTARRVEAKQLAQISNPLTQARPLEICANFLARDYRPGHNPWLHGSIATRLQSGLHYEVQVSPGILWRGHIDQLSQILREQPITFVLCLYFVFYPLYHSYHAHTEVSSSQSRECLDKHNINLCAVSLELNR